MMKDQTKLYQIGGKKLTQSEMIDRVDYFTKNKEEQEATLRDLNKEVQKLEHMNKYLVMGQQKRDEIIAYALEENRRLKEDLRNVQRQAQANANQHQVQQKVKLEQNKNIQQVISGETEAMQKFSLFESIVEDEENFIDRFNSLDVKLQHDFIENIRQNKNDFKNLLELCLRLKKLIKSSHQISISLVLSEAMDRIIKETCQTLNCDRASVFILDEQHKVLWTKAAKGTGAIRIDMDKGIVGFVAMTGQILNIQDAYLDSRFNKQHDIATNYRTKTILCIPIKDVNGKIMGVCQAINKQDGNLFTSDDEVLFELLTSHAGVMIKNSLINEMSMMQQQTLKSMLNIYNRCLSCTSLKELAEITEREFKNVISNGLVFIFITNPEQNCIFRVNEQNQTIDIKEKSLALLSFETKQPHYSNEIEYNTEIDLKAHETMIQSVPIINKNNEQNYVYGVVQTTFSNSQDQGVNKTEILDKEITEWISSMLIKAWDNIIRIKYY